VLPDLYRGEYRLVADGVEREKGTLHMTFRTWQTDVVSLDVAVLQIALIREGILDQDWSLLEARRSDTKKQDFVFAGLSLDGRGTFSASGFSNPDHFSSFGPRRCALQGLMQFQSQLSEGRSPRRLVPGIPEALYSRNSSGTSRSLLPPGVAGPEGMSIEWTRGEQALSDLMHQNMGTLTGQVIAADCGFVVSFRVDPIDRMRLSHKLVRYTLWAIVLTLLEVRCFHRQTRHTEDLPSIAKVSAIGMAMQAMIDAYSAFVHFFLGLSSGELFNIIAVVALLKFVQFSLLEARYLLQIWRSRRQDEYMMTPELETSLRWQIMWFYSGFYAVLVGGMLLVRHRLSCVPFIVVMAQFYWLPQILLDVWQGTKHSLSPVFYIGTSIWRTLGVLYIFGCPQGIFAKDLYPIPGAPSFAVCAIVVFIQAAQVGIMFSQEKYGARWFIPWLCMPWAHNYKYKGGLEDGTECVICMSEIDTEDGRHAVTPCAHRFHFDCLQQWLDVKMECPTCRATLPPIL